MLVTKAARARGRVGAHLGHRRRCRHWRPSRSAARSARARSSRPSSDEKLERARALGADVAVNHADGDVVQAVKDATGGRGVDVVVETVGEATWERSLAAAAPDGRVVVCGATSGHSPPARALPALVEAARRLRLDDGIAVGLRGRLRAHPHRARARPRRQRVPARRARARRTSASSRAPSSARSSSTDPRT